MAHQRDGILARFRLDGRLALITGASRNIGAAIARSFAEAGARLVLNARGAEPLEALAAELRAAHGSDVTTVAADLSQPEDVARLVAATAAVAARLDVPLGVIVNNATSSGRGPTSLGTSRDDWQEAMQVNVLAPLELVRAFAPAMRTAGRGAIVNLLSTAAFAPVPPMIAYASMKSALWTSTRYLARELGPEIRVNAVCPGTVNEGGVVKGASWPRLIPRNAIPRVGEPEEVACAVLYLASDAASFTTGEVIFVDGGRVSTQT